jgi:arsenate reductase-like glutaredoxin family protein
VLAQNGIPYEERDIFRQPLSVEELRALLGNHLVREAFAWRSPRAKALGLVGKTLSDEEMLALMSREPALIRPPIVVADERRFVQPKAAELAVLRQARMSGRLSNEGH